MSGETTFTADLGSGVVVVRPARATICSQCGEEWIDDATARRLEQVVNDARSGHREVELNSGVTRLYRLAPAEIKTRSCGAGRLGLRARFAGNGRGLRLVLVRDSLPAGWPAPSAGAPDCNGLAAVPLRAKVLGLSTAGGVRPGKAGWKPARRAAGNPR